MRTDKTRYLFLTGCLIKNSRHGIHTDSLLHVGSFIMITLNIDITTDYTCKLTVNIIKSLIKASVPLILRGSSDSGHIHLILKYAGILHLKFGYDSFLKMPPATVSDHLSEINHRDTFIIVNNRNTPVKLNLHRDCECIRLRIIFKYKLIGNILNKIESRHLNTKIVLKVLF